MSNSNPELFISGEIEGSGNYFSGFYKKSMFLPFATVVYILVISFGFGMFSGFFSKRYQMVIRNEENYSEKTTISFTYKKVVVYSVILFTIIFFISLMLSKTVLRKWVEGNPKTEVSIPDSLQ